VITEATLATQAERRLVLAELGVEPVANPSVIVIGPVAGLDLRCPPVPTPLQVEHA
jgi:hypothetical protein